MLLKLPSVVISHAVFFSGEFGNLRPMLLDFLFMSTLQLGLHISSLASLTFEQLLISVNFALDLILFFLFQFGLQFLELSLFLCLKILLDFEAFRFGLANFIVLCHEFSILVLVLLVSAL